MSDSNEMPQAQPPITYSDLVSLFTTQLTISIHTILSARSIYPAQTFLKARAYNLPVMQSRHPGVCAWINDAVTAVEVELLKGTVARIALVIFEAWRENDRGAEDKGDDAGESEFDSSGSRIDPEARSSREAQGSRPLERYVWDVSRWPEIPKSEQYTPFSRFPGPPLPHEEQLKGEISNEEQKAKFQEILRRAHSDLHEQFRGLLSRLSTICTVLAPLPGSSECTFTLCIELKEESDPPIGHPQAWIPAEKSTQRRILHPHDEEGREVGTVEKEGGRSIERGKDLGGARTTPVRTVDSGEMIFEMWIEEGRAKFESDGKR